ncbi:MAG TPA: adenosylcobinamide-GDP ribazoletransferase [Ilumatobacteraceae bacterium]
MRNLRAAFAFLTRIPVPASAGEPFPLTSAVPWFPLVGACVGAAVGGAVAGLVHLVPPIVAAAVGVVFGVAVTGAFHEDGLADVADAFVGGWTREDRMRILDDPRHGSYGVAALCGSIVVRVVCVAALGVSPAVAFACVLAAHALGRCAAVGLMITMPTASREGLAARATQALPRRSVIVGIAVGVAAAGAATGWWIGPLAVAALVAAVGVGWYAQRKIGGITGDVLGAAEQLAECLVLVTATGLAMRSSLWW